MNRRPQRFDVVLVTLDPTQGSEIRKTRPCVVISPDELNQHLATIIVAPMTTQGKLYPTRVPCTFQRKKGLIVLDQLRTIDKSRVVKKMGRMDEATSRAVLGILLQLFAW